METVHGKWNLNWQLADTPYFVVEYDSGFVIKSIDGDMGTMLPIRVIENNNHYYYCCENDYLYSQQDINKLFNMEGYSISPIPLDFSIETTPRIAADSYMGEELVEEFDVLDMVI